MTMYTHHDATNAAGTYKGRGWTPSLWNNCPWRQIEENPQFGYTFFTDFVGWDSDLWTVTNATSGTMAAISGVGGVARVSAGAATNDQGVTAAQPGGAAAQFITLSASTRLWFETLAKQTPQTASGYGATWIGLATIAEGLSSAGAPAGTDRLGFLSENSATNSVLFNYKDAGGSEYEADTTFDYTTGEWVRLGFYVEGLSRVTPYINGVAQSTIVATTTYPIPDAIMNICLANVANGGTGTPTSDFDWVRLAVAWEPDDIVTL